MKIAKWAHQAVSICIGPSRLIWTSDDGHWQTKRDKLTDFNLPRICHSYNIQNPYSSSLYNTLLQITSSVFSRSSNRAPIKRHIRRGTNRSDQETVVTRRNNIQRHVFHTSLKLWCERSSSPCCFSVLLR